MSHSEQVVRALTLARLEKSQMSVGGHLSASPYVGEKIYAYTR